tara:strand:+ start:854 stop:1126 length:273 start_codon:yes stop_codon:yes gene_type:complete
MSDKTEKKNDIRSYLTYRVPVPYYLLGILAAVIAVRCHSDAPMFFRVFVAIFAFAISPAYLLSYMVFQIVPFGDNCDGINFLIADYVFNN